MWKFELLDWDGVRLGEITNAQNVRMNFGLSKNSNLYFDIHLHSSMGKEIADNDYLLVSAYKKNPTNNTWTLQFIGPIINKEEIGENSLPTVAVNCVGAYWRLSKRIVNNSKNDGRKEKGVAASPSPNIVIIACDTGNNRVVHFNERTGKWIKNQGGTAASTDDGKFDAPQGVAINKTNGDYYILDSGNNRVQQFNAAGTFIRKWGTAGSGTGQIGNGARGIAVDKDGNVWVGDTGNDRVHKFTSTGTRLLTITATSDYRLENIYDVIAYNDRVVVCDTGQTYRHGCQAFDLSGNFLGKETNDALNREYRSWAPSSIKTDTTHATFGDSKMNYFSNKFAAAFVAEFYPRELTVFPTAIGGFAGYNPHHVATRPREGNLDYAYVAFSGSVSSGDGIVSGIYVYSFVSPPTNGNDIPSAIKPVKKIGGAVGSGNGETKNLQYFDYYQSSYEKTGVQVAVDAINNTNTLDGNSWISPASTQGTSPGVSIDFNTWGGYKKITDAIDDLAGNLEWKVIPKLENAGLSTLKLGEWYGNSVLGTNKSSTVNFEYGTARLNVRRYSIKQTIEGITNQVAYPSVGYIPYAVVSRDQTSINDIGFFEDVLTGSVILPELRKELTDLYINLRKYPRTLVEIEPVRSDVTTGATVPVPLFDYEPGDFLGILIKDDNNERINGEVRLYDIEINLDNNGKEDVVLKLYVDESSA